MSYATLMVHLELDRANASLLKFGCAMAERFRSRVVGIAAGQPIVYPFWRPPEARRAYCRQY